VEASTNQVQECHLKLTAYYVDLEHTYQVGYQEVVVFHVELAIISLSLEQVAPMLA
jgi:hypothetical protein